MQHNCAPQWTPQQLKGMQIFLMNPRMKANTFESFELSTKNNDLKLRCASSQNSPKRHIYIKEKLVDLESIQKLYFIKKKNLKKRGQFQILREFWKYFLFKKSKRFEKIFIFKFQFKFISKFLKRFGKILPLKLSI